MGCSLVLFLWCCDFGLVHHSLFCFLLLPLSLLILAAKGIIIQPIRLVWSRLLEHVSIRTHTGVDYQRVLVCSSIVHVALSS
ncbi:hypothetical protein V8F33_002995 [Rhypophila sp. PSN 637]